LASGGLPKSVELILGASSFVGGCSGSPRVLHQIERHFSAMQVVMGPVLIHLSSPLHK
jgi:hypothetical protein